MTKMALTGISGGNPLGFMSALGALLLMREVNPCIKLSWEKTGGGWQPVVHGCAAERDSFVETLLHMLKNASLEPFEIDKKLPFPVGAFISKLIDAQARSKLEDRRLVDLLAAYGTELHPKGELFEDTSFRMVRTGDSNKQGLLSYAVAIKKSVTADTLRRALFEPWNYRDYGPILRWDPIEDQRYALVWNNPEDKAKKQVKVMLGADALALEALAFFPVIPEKKGAITTGFFRSGLRQFFTWPIWIYPATVDVVRSLITTPELHREYPGRDELATRGISEIFRCERMAPNKYYKNFTVGVPV
ncbi:MAG: hypothetical protein AAGU11_07025 [Syntrophobacteraceae bacterium]